LDRADPEMSRRYFWFQARLKPGLTMQQAQADAEVVARRLAEVYPDNYPEKFNVEIISWIDSIVGQFRTALYTLGAAVGLLLLIACGNVANMLLARASTREKEMAVRSALGARQWQLIRQLLVESLLLGLAGAAAGCAFAYAGIKVLVPMIPEGTIPGEALIQLNVPVLLFSLGAALLTALLFGLAPALQAARPDLADPLKDAGRGVSGGFRRGKLRNTLVVIQVALSLVLLAGAGLMMRTFMAVQNADLGFNPDNILVARLPLPRGQDTTAETKHQFFRTLLQRLHALPGVVAATETTTLPPHGGLRSEIDIPGKTHLEKWEAIYQLCSEGYFPTLRLRLLRGRLLSEVDVNDARRVAVVNQTLAKQYFGDEDPLGHQIKIKALETLRESPVENPVFEIVGVISDAKNQGIQDPVLPEMFVPYTLTGEFERGILVRTAGEPVSLLNNVRSEIWGLDRGVALTLTGSLNEYLQRFSYAQPRFSLMLLTVFAGVGLALVALGVYSVIAYTVSRQTQEIGLRMALGAGGADVLRMVLRMGLRLIAVGVIVGTLTSLGAARVIASQLWGVSPHDPATLVGVVVLVILAGLAACYFPARRATRVDPLVALRYE
jgi:putative ABC transport system permease protein